MKKLLLLCLILASFVSYAQYNNGWIDYSKTYYKFKLGSTGLCRIIQDALPVALSNIPAQQFQLWRNGEEVRLYTSVSSGPLPSGGYIEFWGLMNDGKKDTRLYRVADYQLSDAWSLETDTAAYFLTVNPSGNNLRFTNTVNNVSGTTLSAEPYFMNTIGIDYRDKINPGYAADVTTYVYSSSYETGEGLTSFDVYPGSDLNPVFGGLNLYPSGPPASMSIAAAGNAAANPRDIMVKFFSTTIMDTAMDYFNYLKKTVTGIPLSTFTNPDYVNVTIRNTSVVPTDRMVVSSIHIKYPSKFNFNNQKNFYFELPASTTGNYLVIDNFNFGATSPVILDMNTGNRYIGDLSTPGKVKVVLPPSADPVRKFEIVSEDISNINGISNFIIRNFINVGLPANQANYIIVSNPILYNNGSGINYVDQYRAYRASTVGGGYNAKVYDIDQLTDQFGYGIKNHPFSIKDFIQYSRTHFIDSPRYVFLIGKGVSYDEYKFNESSAKAQLLNIVPTYGYPASDMSLSADYNSFIPRVPIGRLSAINGTEVGIYLAKMKEYELAQHDSSTQTVDNKAWMKKGIHVAGGSSLSESGTFVNYLDTYKALMQDVSYGADVETFIKSDVAAIQIASTQRITDLFNSGLGYIQYFGHSSANSLAFNLNSPETYNNQGKYPFFSVSGCTAGNIFAFDSTRLTGNLTLSEKYILIDHKGSIAFLASTHLGIPPFLNNYDYDLYQKISKDDYGKTAGIQIRDVIADLAPDTYPPDFFTRMNLEEMTLHGDPALKINSFSRPDFVVEAPMVKLNPSIISVADNSFQINILMRNIGKAVNDSIRVTVKRKLPDGTLLTLYNQRIAAIRNQDSLSLTSTIHPLTDKGLNQIQVTLDADGNVDELSENNNYVAVDFYIFEDEVRPVYPYNYSIMNQSNISYYGSTANPLLPNRQVQLEIDTTELFNSAFKKSYSTNSTGGVIQFTPSITYTDSTVYYWRIGMTPVTGSMIWNGSSFVYLPLGGKGFNSSHYYQHLEGSFDKITYNPNRVFEFTTQPVVVNYSEANYPPNDYPLTYIQVGPVTVSNWGNNFGALEFVALNPHTLDGFPNGVVNATEGKFQSITPGITSRQWQFEYLFSDINWRNKAMRFLDSVPAGYYVFVYNHIYNGVAYSYVNSWLGDAAINGGGQSLYNKLTGLGFSKLDSFSRNVPFMFIYKKGDPSFTPVQRVGTLSSDVISDSLILQQSSTVGSITSPVFGPARAWNQLHWRGKDVEASSPDVNYVEVYGIDSAGNNVLQATVNPARDTSLSFINASTYRYLKLKLVTSDRLSATPQQLSYLRVNADYVPEGAVAPNLVLRMKDTVAVGAKIDFALAFKNISETAFDSLKIRIRITDRSNVAHDTILPRKRPLIAGDSLVISYTIDTRNYAGMNTLYVEVNPDNDQPEQFHFNNFIYKNFYVTPDTYNPLLDVTFDGVHILNRDIVSARPHIVIKLKDESQYLALNDTSLLKVQIRYPGVNGLLKTYRFDNDTMRFTPANLATGNNTATVDLSPLLPGNDDDYQLIVSGKDVSGNSAGNLDYNVSFQVISKPMISNFLNYPNPFTSSTAFVFTITGTDVPQNIRIQIMTVTGKIVKEITKSELGPLHIGRNITDYKWDGTDTYGQKLGNGVYLYRVLTNLNGKSLDKYTADGDNTDKYFTKGYGKMYLMR